MDLMKFAGIDPHNHTYSVETRLLHLTDPEGSGPVIPDMSMAVTVMAKDSAELAERFMSLIRWAPGDGIPEGAWAIYQRLGTPMELKLAQAFALIEGGEAAIVFSDGMRAISSAVGFRTFASAEVIVGVPVYGCTDNFFTGTLPSQGRVVRFVDLTKGMEAIKAHIGRKTRVIYLETLANPNLRMADMAALKALVAEVNGKRHHDERITLIVDNTFATPYCCNPLHIGPPLEDMIVVHSTTKGINGFSQGLGGVAVIPWSYWKALLLYRKDNGGILSSYDIHSLLTKSLRTMPLRLRQSMVNAQALAEMCEAHPAVHRVIYPGLPSFPQYELAQAQLRSWDGSFAPGHMMGLILAGRTDEDRERAGRRLMDILAERSRVFVLAVSLGYVGTLIEEPTSGTHATMGEEERREKGIDRGYIRVSVGIERKEDILVDMYRALEQVQAEFPLQSPRGLAKV